MNKKRKKFTTIMIILLFLFYFAIHFYFGYKTGVKEKNEANTINKNTEEHELVD